MANTANRRPLIYAGLIASLLIGTVGFGYGQLPAIGAGALLHPARSRVTMSLPPQCEEATVAGAEATLRGWNCRTPAQDRAGTIVYLHGIADNRASARGVIDRFNRQRFDVVAFDSRAHGDSDGDACTYGFWETRDLQRILQTVGHGPIVLIGTSLGAAVALQHAADNPRISAVMAAETFSDLRTIARERAPRFFTAGVVARAFEMAEAQGRFEIDVVSPVTAAARITAPVLLIHGAEDIETVPAHSRRVFEALRGPKRLLLVPGAGHNESLRPEVWAEIDAWLDDVRSAWPAGSGR